MSEENGAGPVKRDVDPVDELDADQLTALEALLRGETVTDAADAAGVHRTTVHRWRREDPEFRAALNRERARMQDRVRMRLMKAADHAAETVHDAVAEDGDVQAAFKLLKGLGMLDGERPEVGMTAAWVYRMDDVLARQRRRQWKEVLRAIAEAEPSQVEILEKLAEGIEKIFETSDIEVSKVELVERFTERMIEEGILDEDPGFGVVSESKPESAEAHRKNKRGTRVQR